MSDQDLLFHYTSQAGLLGILKNREIWATNIHYLNDFKEFRHCLELIQSSLLTALNRNMSVRDEVLQKFTEICSLGRNLNIFVTSFSAKGDLLSQWRGYCNEGTGYSIGFNKHTLQKLASAHGFVLHECIYDSTIQYGEINKYVNDIITYNSTVKGNLKTLILIPPLAIYSRLQFKSRRDLKIKHFQKNKSGDLFPG